jgi:uncharacterized protein (TIGR02599 family)
MTIRSGRSAFTLVEVMLASAILAVLVLMFASMVSQTSSLWRRTSGKIEQFREARNAFELLTTRVSQATLNTYWDYDNPVNPTRYERRSELRFITGQASTMLPASGVVQRPTHCVFFQAPLGVTAFDSSGKKKYQGYENLLCACGYYVEYNDDRNLRPGFISPTLVPYRYRHRLMQFLLPADNNIIYNYTSGPGRAGVNTNAWYQPLAIANPPVYSRPIAENIVALIITPRLAPEDEAGITKSTPDESPIAPQYSYDTTPGAGTGARYTDARLNPTNQLPPILQVTMVAIDETSAIRIGLSDKSGDIFNVAKKFTASADYGKDLLVTRDTGSLEATLIQRGVNYRIFNTNVTIRGAKWSRQQSK